MKTNFKKKNDKEITNFKNKNKSKNDLTKEEFEEYIIKSGARGSFVVYRSQKKNEELGLDEL